MGAAEDVDELYQKKTSAFFFFYNKKSCHQIHQLLISSRYMGRSSRTVDRVWIMCFFLKDISINSNLVSYGPSPWMSVVRGSQL